MKKLNITDKPGKNPTIATMRSLFESTVRNTPQFASSTPLGIMEVSGQFLHYMDPDTDTMWIGYAIGLRTAQRIMDRAGLPFPVALAVTEGEPRAKKSP